MKRLSSIILSFLFLMSASQAQMTINGQTLYGNEWINHSQDYYKFYVTADGMYRISQQALSDAGVPLGSISSGQFQLYAMGNQVPIHVSATGAMGGSDYIEFYGERNKGDLDVHLYKSKDDHFNPQYSMFTDTTTYFLTWAGGATQFQNTPNNLAGVPTAEPYFMDQALYYSNKKYNKGESFGGLQESRFSAGEGFGTKLARNTTLPLTVSNVYTGGPDTELRMRFASKGEGANHNIQIEVNDNPLLSVADSTTYYNYRMRQVEKDFPTSFLSNGANTVDLDGNAGTTDQHTVSFAMLTYPSRFNFGNASSYKFNIAADPASKKYLEITNFNHGGTVPVLYDLTNNLRITTTLNGSTVRVALPPSTANRELILVSQNHNYTAISEVNKMNFVDFSKANNQGDYIIISNPLLMDDGAGNNYVQNYATYRASTGYTPVIITTEQLYDQFAYGISRHSQSVRNLTGYSLANWTPKPRYMFMIGKSRPYYSVRRNWAKQPAFTTTFGHEPSDALLTATTQSDAPRLSFGKLPATNPDQIRIYLDKVMTYENVNATLPQTVEDKAWRKRVLHLGGGDPNIQSTIVNNLGNYEAQVSDEYYGGDVVSFIQNSAVPSTNSATRTLDSLISGGSSLMTFFGHSTPNNIDFNINAPEAYDNVDKYPVFFSLGCYSGQIHTKTFGMSEQFVFAEDRGAIAFLATVWLSSLGALDVFGDMFYQKLSKDNYGEGIGDIWREAITALSTDLNVYNRIVYQQMTLNGDPAVRVNTETAPDYIVQDDEINFAPTIPESNQDIELTFPVYNLGKTESQPFKLLVERILPDGTTLTVVDEMITVTGFEQELTYTIPAIETAAGMNDFRVIVDSDDIVVELPNPDAEGNNVGMTNLFVYDNIVNPISPSNYSIQGDDTNILLQAEINSRYANQSLNYIIQIDTTELFNSPLKQSTSITQAGGTLSWAPPVSYTDETVYYWRVVAAPGQVANSGGWKGLSYTYIGGEYPGWNQSHHYQFMDDRYSNTLVYNEDTREFEFVSGGIEVVVSNAHVGILTSDKIDYAVGGSRIYDVEGCEAAKQGFTIALFDEDNDPIINTAVNLANNVGEHGSYICKPSQLAFTFLTDTPAGQQNLINFLNNILPTLTDVSDMLIYSLNDYLPETFSPALFSALANLGLVDIQNSATLGGVPYAGLVDLENGTVQEEMAANEGDIIEAIFSIKDPWENGSMFSTIIGPASEWGSVHWDVTNKETDDDAHINVYGISANGNRTLLMSGLTATDHIFNQSTVDAAQYPYLQLEYVAVDKVNNTPPQLDFWRVIYESDPCYQLKLTAILEGPYDSGTGQMTTTLSADRKILPGQIPINNLVQPTPAGQPYSTAPWNYAGTEGLNFTNSSYTGDEVDWVLVGLRTASQKSDEVAQAAGLLMKDGTIKFPIACPIETVHPGPFYVVVEHRNHMGVMSAQPVNVSNKEIVVDFTAQDSYRDATGTGQKQLTSGVWVMLSGDLGQNSDIQSYDINGGDKILWSNGNGNFDDYRPSDADLNGDTNGSDKIFWERNNGKSSRVPR